MSERAMCKCGQPYSAHGHFGACAASGCLRFTPTEPKGETMDPKRMSDENFDALEKLVLSKVLKISDRMREEFAAESRRARASEARLERENEVLRKVPDAIQAAIDTHGGCGDSSCLVKRPKGMATNGGCRCFKDLDHDRRYKANALVRGIRATLRTAATEDGRKKSEPEPVCADCGHDYFDHGNGTHGCMYRAHGNALECSCAGWEPRAATEDGTK